MPVQLMPLLKKAAVAVGALVVVAGAVVVIARARGAIVPGLPARPLAGLIDQPLASGDSARVASFAQGRCRFLRGRNRQRCYEEILLALVERNQVHLAMTALAVLDARDPSIRRRGHDYTHVVGINAWTPGEDLGAVYDSCTGLFQSGCYHGVIQAYLDANGADSSTVAPLCDLIPSSRTSRWLRFQCIHGIGHGLVQANALHLPRALGGCDWLPDAWDHESCYGGAFMEFILAGRGQEHHPASHRQPATPTDEHAGHAEHAAAAADSFPIRKRTDPLYPCSALDQKYQWSCYGMQAGLIVEITGPNFRLVAEACDMAPARMRPICYQGIGTYVSGATVRNPTRTIAACMQGNPAYRAWCFAGVAKNFVDVTWNPKDGLDFCRRVTDPALAASCYVAVGEEMGVLTADRAERERLCATLPERPRVACRFGAGLSADRPPDLQVYVPEEGS